MLYNYTVEKPRIFTEEGQVIFLKIRDRINEFIKTSGAFRADKVLSNITGTSFQHRACLDRMIELGEIVCLSSDEIWGQYKVYTKEV